MLARLPSVIMPGMIVRGMIVRSVAVYGPVMPFLRVIVMFLGSVLIGHVIVLTS